MSHSDKDKKPGWTWSFESTQPQNQVFKDGTKVTVEVTNRTTVFVPDQEEDTETKAKTEDNGN